MATAVITVLGANSAPIGGKVRVNVKYTGTPPSPDDLHVMTREGGAGSFTESAAMDINPAPAANPGIDLDWPVGNAPGAFDLRIDWTWKRQDRREIGASDGRYYATEAGAPSPVLQGISEILKTILLPVAVVLGIGALPFAGLCWLLYWIDVFLNGRKLAQKSWACDVAQGLLDAARALIPDWLKELF